MPSRKIISVLILCIGVILSVWLFTNKPQTKAVTTDEDAVPAVAAINIEGKVNEDWKKMLTSVDPKNSKVVDLTKNQTSTEDDTTLTDQMSRDFMAQYLLAVKNGTDLTPEVADTIAKNTLSLPEYSKKSVVYIKSNLKVTPRNDKETWVKYQGKINQALMPLYFEVKDDPLRIFSSAVSREDEAELKKLDPIILSNKSVIKYLLEIEVPESAIQVHLELLNASASILSDLESMRVAIGDPVRGLPALGYYSEDAQKFAVALSNMNVFLLQRTI